MGRGLVWLHVLAAVSWIGGMVFLSLVLVPVLKGDSFASQRGALIRAVALRFRPVVWTAIAVLLTTGPLLVRQHGWPLDDPSGWPAVLGLKLALVVLLLALTAAHDFVLGPRIGRMLQTPEASRTDDDRRLVRWASWLPRLSLLLALAVLGAATAVVRL